MKRYEDFNTPSEYLENTLKKWDSYYSSNGGMYKAISAVLEENKKFKAEFIREYSECLKGNVVVKFVIPSDVYAKFVSSLKGMNVTPSDVLSAFIDKYIESEEN